MATTPRFTASILVAIVLMATAGESQAPTPYQTYREVVAAYVKTRDVSRVVEPLQEWSGREFDDAIKATIAARIPAELKAAAILHLEIGVALVGVNAAIAGGHVSYGNELLDRWTATQPRVDPAVVNGQKQFRATWLAVAGSAFAAVKDPGRAKPLLNKALDALPRSARAQTLLGALKEFDASQFNPDDAATVAQRERNRRERLIRLIQAERDYREAIRFEANYALAHIRLGRVLHLTGKPGEARASLERGLTMATEPLPKYLGALFLGALQQDERDIPAARLSFEQAIAIAPSSQPAVVALAHLEVMAGRPDRANALARGLAEAARSNEPWWAFHYGGLDIAGMRWLREQEMQ